MDKTFAKSSAWVSKNVVLRTGRWGGRGTGMEAGCLLILCCHSTSDLPDCGWVGAWAGCESVPMSLFSLQKREICCRVCLGGFCGVVFNSFFISWRRSSPSMTCKKLAKGLGRQGRLKEVHSSVSKSKPLIRAV